MLQLLVESFRRRTRFACALPPGNSKRVRAQSNSGHRLFVTWFKRGRPPCQSSRGDCRTPAGRRPCKTALIDLRNRTGRLSRPTVVSQLCSGSRNRARAPSASASITLHRITTRQQKRIRQRPAQNRFGHTALRQGNDRHAGPACPPSQHAPTPLRPNPVSRNRSQPPASVLARRSRNSTRSPNRHKPSPPIVGARRVYPELRRAVPVFFCRRSTASRSPVQQQPVQSHCFWRDRFQLDQ
jgi:hypothetical protein